MTDVANCGSFIVLIKPVVKQVFRCNSSENKVNGQNRQTFGRQTDLTLG